MKKATIIMAVALAAGLSSCSVKQTPETGFDAQVDSLSYTWGLANSNGLDRYLAQLGLDSTYVTDFLKGLSHGASITNKKDIAYQAGVSIGQNLLLQIIPNMNRDLFMTDTLQTVNKDLILAGIADGVTAKKGSMDMDEAQVYVNLSISKIKEKSLEKMYADYKAENEKFLEENKNKEGVQTTASGLQYKVLKQGNGPVPDKDTFVKIRYKGMMIDSTEFDNNYKAPAPSRAIASRFVKGFSEALQLMPEGSKWQLFIPQKLGYGARATGKIKPFSTLIFEVELVEVEPKKDKK